MNMMLSEFENAVLAAERPFVPSPTGEWRTGRGELIADSRIPEPSLSRSGQGDASDTEHSCKADSGGTTMACMEALALGATGDMTSNGGQEPAWRQRAI